MRPWTTASAVALIASGGGGKSGCPTLGVTRYWKIGEAIDENYCHRLTKRNEAGSGTQRAPFTFSPWLFIFDTWANDSIINKSIWKSWTTLCRAPQTCLAEDSNCVGPWHFIICCTLLALAAAVAVALSGHGTKYCSFLLVWWCVHWGMAKPRLSAELFHFADHGIKLQSRHAPKSNWLTPTTKLI